MGAGLLAKAVCHSTMILNDMTSSRASPLPQGVCMKYCLTQPRLCQTRPSRVSNSSAASGPFSPAA
ncbi:hypothetical protein C1884_22380 [Pseudomonas sp. GW460-R15]|nr:hypothetical protein C1887_15150 [Pseudomonas sp. GW456-R21]POA63941.1 hypothetical protein C1884_22380 [Pseudomonas sp. GW460-R15]